MNINTSRGVLFSVRIDNKKEMIAATVHQENSNHVAKKVDINEAHMFFGHLSEKMTTMTAKRLGI
jgi:hypothetical protein